MSRIVPRVAVIQDISGFGRCSLTVIMPILSCMGVQVCPMPTAVLSTHGGGFGKMAFIDLTEYMQGCSKHWEELNLSFDYIYTGFLGSEAQINEVMHFCDKFNKNAKVLIDPVMGDNGKLYSLYNETMQAKMRDLVQIADIITPNLTEALFLLGKPYKIECLSVEQMKDMLKSLTEMGPHTVIIKGITDENGNKVNIAYSKETEVFYKIPYVEVPASYPGTGDVFASILIGAVLQGNTLEKAIKRASAFITAAIRETYLAKTDTREGILLERVLPLLFEQ